MNVDVSLVIPAFNEVHQIPNAIREATKFFSDQDYSWELIVVDDGSSDKTDQAARAAMDGAGDSVTLIRNEVNRGKGYAVKRGMLAAKGNHVFFTDADLSTPIEEIKKCLPQLMKADIVIGSRALADSNIKIRQSRRRELMGQLYNIAVKAAVVRGINDTQCGFKGFSKNAAKETFARQSLDGFGFDVEVLYIATKLGFKIMEVPITWSNSADTRVSPIPDGLGMLSDLARVRINDLRGLYGR